MHPIAIRFVVAVIAAGVSLLTPLRAHALYTTTSVTLAVGSSADDYKETSTGVVTQGDSQQDLWTSADDKYAMRFSNTNVPPGAHIVSALLKVYADGFLSENITGYAVGEASGSSHAYTGTTHEISRTPQTIAKVTVSNLPTWVNATHNLVADVAPIVQEIVDREDFQRFNPITIFLINNYSPSRRRTRTYNTNASKAARLEITYNLLGCPAPVPPAATCPTTIEITPNALTSLDLGWTGEGHDAAAYAVDTKFTLAVEHCGGSGPCGVCDLHGPLPPRFGTSPQSQRCANNTAVACSDDVPCFRQCVGGTNDGAGCTTDSDCPDDGAGCTTGVDCPVCVGPGTCETYAGSYVTGPTCVATQIRDDITGTINVDTGQTALTIPQRSFLKLAGCPKCEGDSVRNDGKRGGTCTGHGQRRGKSCDANGRTYAPDGETSLDCPPGGLGAGFISDLVTDTASKLMRVELDPETPETDSPPCNAAPGRRCLCGVCNVVNGERSPCANNADCTAVGASTCSAIGGDLPTQPNACRDAQSTGGAYDTCTDAGECTYDDIAGFPTKVCTSKPSQTCQNDGDCPYATCSGGSRDGELCQSPSECLGGTCTPDTCVARHRRCYPDRGTVGGTVRAIGNVTTIGPYEWNMTLTALGCAGNAGGALSTVLGLPGVTRLELPAYTAAVAPATPGVVFANYNGPNRLCLYAGGSTFSCSDVSASTTYSQAVAIADLNHDGLSDLVFANGNGQPNTRCLGTGTGFSCSALPGTLDPNESTDVALGDLNNDGHIDAVFARKGQHNQICVNDGTGTFTCSIMGGEGPIQTNGVALGDFNRDGKLDLVFAKSNTGTNVHNRVCLAWSTPLLYVCHDVSADQQDSADVAVADFNGDGLLDLVFANTERVPPVGYRNRICLGDGAGNFSCSNVSNVGYRSVGVTAADINGDGLPDAVFSNTDQQPNRACWGNGLGAFLNCGDFGGDAFATMDAAVVGDLNHDCANDVIFANTGGSEKNRICLGDNWANPTCSNASTDAYQSHGVAVGNF